MRLASAGNLFSFFRQSTNAIAVKEIRSKIIFLNFTYKPSTICRHTRGSQNVPGNVVYQCNGWTYDNAYLITFKAGPLRTHTHTHTHKHTHTCSIDPAIVGSTGGRLLLESSAVRPSHSMSSMVAKCVPLRPIFRVGNSQNYSERDPEITVVG